MQDQQFEMQVFTVKLTADGRLQILHPWGKKVIADAPLVDVTQVEVRSGMAGSIRCYLRYRKDGAIKRLMTIRGKAADQWIWSFLSGLYARLPPGVAIDDHVSPDVRDPARTRVYPVGGRIFGMSHDRWGILLFWWCMALTIVFLPFAIWVSRRYRLTTDARGYTLARFGTRRGAWSEVTGYLLVRINRRVNFAEVSSLFRITFVGGPTFVLNGLETKRLTAELAVRGIRAAA